MPKISVGIRILISGESCSVDLRVGEEENTFWDHVDGGWSITTWVNENHSIEKIGPKLDIEIICTALGLNRHDVAEATRLYGNSENEKV